jgi:hypothetical protein
MNATATIENIIKTDLQAHIEDTDIVSAIRNGKLVNISWNELTEDEKRQAYNNMFLASGLY